MTDQTLIADEMESALNRALHDWDGVFYWDVTVPEDGGFVFHLMTYRPNRINPTDPVISTYYAMTEHDAWTAIGDLDAMFKSNWVNLDRIREFIFAQTEDR